METAKVECYHHGNRRVPPSGGSLEIGNSKAWDVLVLNHDIVPPSGGSLEIGNGNLLNHQLWWLDVVPPSGGSLEIGNTFLGGVLLDYILNYVPPSGGSLEIGNRRNPGCCFSLVKGSPFGGIPRNWKLPCGGLGWDATSLFPLRGDP